MRIIKKGATDQSVYFEVLDGTSTDGDRLTGLVYNTASLTAYYARNGAASVQITLATLAAASSAHSDGGFKEVDATNMPGVYRLDLPDAAVASGAESVVVTIRGATNMVQVSSEIQLQDYATELLDLANGVETGYTLRQIMRLLSAVVLGEGTDLSTGTKTFRDVNDTVDRVVTTMTGDDRTNVLTP